MAEKATSAVVERAATHGERWSDHSPVTVVYDVIVVAAAIVAIGIPVALTTLRGADRRAAPVNLTPPAVDLESAG